MKKIYILVTFFMAFCFIGVANLCAADDYFTDDEVKVNDQGYIMSWLILDPFISDGILSGPACQKDYFDAQGGEANIMPREGDVVTIAETGTEHEWVRLNFFDLAAEGKIPAAVGGNEFDIQAWGGQGPTNTQEYMVTYLKWDSDTKVKFTIGVDDASEAYFNGEKIIEDPNSSQNWAAGNSGSAEVDAKGGVWNVLVVGCYESGGEWGITVQVDPIPDAVNSSGPEELFPVEPVDKLPMTWGEIKE
jgi:hypothetical protein